MAIGVFGLQVAYRLKRLEVMSTANTHGWFGGGSVPAVVSTVDRIDFSNDTGTANIRGSLSVAKNFLAAIGNSNYGWFGGGYTTVSLSTVDRIDFSNDSGTVSPRGPLSLARNSGGATGNSNYGWFGGGSTTLLTQNSRVDRIDFSTDSSTASSRGPLSLSRYNLTATGNSNYGWFGGGGSGPALSFVPLSTVDRIDFSNDSGTTSVRGPLTLSTNLLAATGNSNYGWFGGGSPGIPYVSTVNRVDFSNDLVTTSLRGTLSTTKQCLAATGNSNYGWFGGGQNPTRFSTVDRIDFSNDSSTVSVRGPLSSARGYVSATSGQAKGPAIKLQKAGNYGWFGGGVITGPAISATVNRIDFSNDSPTASPRGSLSVTRTQHAATGNSNYGWFGGGTTNGAGPGTTATVDRIDFSNDSSTASPRGALSSARRLLSATGNSNYGWFGGGGPGLIVDRIDFSNDSSTASPRGALSSARYQLAATGNSNYGWFGGGATGPTTTTYSTVDRINFSNDAETASVRGPLSSPARYGVAATGNSNYGWFGGGIATFPTPSVATVNRIDFSNDSSTLSVRGPLSSARYQLAATGNSNYGWFGGGSTAFPSAGTPPVVTVDRIDFSNDSSTASVRGPLSVARNVHAAVSNTPT
jgi:hypothetical protein